MNSIKNDKGEMVTAIGAPGSIERVKVKWPALIEKLNTIYKDALGHEYSHVWFLNEAIEMIRNAGIKSSLETSSILSATLYGNPQIYE